MTRKHIPTLLLCLAALFTAGCEQVSIARQEEARNFQTIQALTPTITPSPTATATATATSTPEPTIGPSPTATETATPSPTIPPTPTPLPPTATPNPDLKGFNLCVQSAGDSDGGRFSAHIHTITATIQPAFERIEFALDLPKDSVAPHATARCMPTANSYAISIDLDGWLHDDGYRTSVTTATQVLSGTKLLKGFQYHPAQADAGASLVFPLDAPHAFRLAFEQSPDRLVLEVAKDAAIGPASDFLASPSSDNVTINKPVFYLQGGDIWSYNQGKITNLTNSADPETALAPNQADNRIAFCRATSAPGDAIEVSSLWVMDSDGSHQQELAAPGRACAEPRFAPDGKSIAFTVDEDATGAQPARLSIWEIDLTSGKGPISVTPANDEWSRFSPEWLDSNQLVYIGHAEDGRSTIYLRDAQNRELDIGAKLLVAEGGQSGQSVARYTGFGAILTAPDGKTIAVEALRADKPGADLLLMDPAGNEQKGTVTNGYWNRPVAFTADGTLYYLSSLCASEATQSYALMAHSANGSDKTLAIGQTTGGFGAFQAIDQGLLYVALEPPGAIGIRGGFNLNGAGKSDLWFWDINNGPRARIVPAPDTIMSIAR